MNFKYYILYCLFLYLKLFSEVTAQEVYFFSEGTDSNYYDQGMVNITAFKSIDTVPAVDSFAAIGYDSHVELKWEYPMADLSYKIFASFDNGATFEFRNETKANFYLDFIPENTRNSSIIYRITATTQGKDSETTEKETKTRNFQDSELLNMVQEYSFRYFWEGAHQPTGMALERSDWNENIVASGATGFGLMAMIVAHEREFRLREDIKDRVLKILDFLTSCDRYHGAWAHWYDANTGKSVPFSQIDDGGDIVETSFVAQALIALKNYFSGQDLKSAQIRERSDQLWKEIEWDWYRQNNQDVLYWHWSPNYNFQINMQVNGWNECLGTYIMAAASPTHGIPKEVYTSGWARNGNMLNNRSYYGYEINLSPNWGGPLFWIHYTHHGINPKGLKDQYADYWLENVNTALIHYEYAKENPLNFKNYSENCWGLTASDDPAGYAAHKPMDNDNGTISPTAALSCMPFTPEESMKALKYFYRERGRELFGKYGPYDAFNDTQNWVKKSYIGIDQGPIVIMIENYRTGLLWKNVMKDTDVQSGLDKLGFTYNLVTGIDQTEVHPDIHTYPNPSNKIINITIPSHLTGNVHLELLSLDGKLMEKRQMPAETGLYTLDCSPYQNGIYLIRLYDSRSQCNAKLVVQK